MISLKPAFPGGFEPVLEEHGVPVEHFGKRNGLDPRMWPRLAGAFGRFRPDIVHTHSYVMRYVLPAWGLARRGTVVHTVHNIAEKEVEPLGRAVHRIAFRAGALPVAISEEVARSFQSMYGFRPVATIPNGADTRHGFRAEAREVWRRGHGFGQGDLLVASVARFEPQKNPLGLIEAFARALAGNPAAHLVMAGEGSMLEASQRLAARLGVGRQVYFSGLCLDVPELLSACDLFVLASDWEGSSVAVMEAMAARLPVWPIWPVIRPNAANSRTLRGAGRPNSMPARWWNATRRCSSAYARGRANAAHRDADHMPGAGGRGSAGVPPVARTEAPRLGTGGDLAIASGRLRGDARRGRSGGALSGHAAGIARPAGPHAPGGGPEAASAPGVA